MSMTNNRIEERGSMLTVLPPNFVTCTSSRYGGKLEVMKTVELNLRQLKIRLLR